MRTPFKWLAGIGLGLVFLLWLTGPSQELAPRATPEQWAAAREAEAETAANLEAIRQIEAEPKLELLAFSWSQEYSYATVEGLVRNISSEPLRSVQAVATFKDKDGTFITSDSAMIEYDPLLPGQESPFKVMTRLNPAMVTAAPSFKVTFGAEIPMKDGRKKK